ncbi:2-oxoacid:acceptor oxidoreductase subunit alpha [Clostridium tertium]|uniref:2-oxoacid:acceptor oxidoreductase subunit alpha n=1 Tax=Clostridium tertium TaxID=1559 RepID=UPI0023314F98|nr:2-oxoacid:acceptor oxidoreductase subunit alpha [Clostridium tertium]MDB1956139.1 2-oxoacid:acceptor oxidoreductase subunit alpha [Clostridium tertium]MDB1958716.1 2-oxoacid:acceptor oxidoreductase subunit alpha [Clostridium tertium]MDB1962007.1 2-oxoacid:acceptor oxidoreductase subunit alpha [Clostridium tertium]MDB1964950.1 2-oxoacid:acceptor oxidoreductase subunit alpha [Clostridium tertium]
MEYNILIGGSAGQGLDTLSDFLERSIKKFGFYVFSNKDYMSRVRGGHNFIQIRFGENKIYSHKNELDLILALDENTISYHKDRLKDDGIIISDKSIKNEYKKIIKLPLIETAKGLSLSKAFTSVAAGVILKYFSIDLENIDKYFSSKLSEDIRNKNIQAVKLGYDLIESKHKMQGNDLSDHILINGNNAIALGAIAGGLDFYSAYPMTPATSIMTYLAKKQVETGMVVDQAEDEIAAINFAIGASYAGARAMTGSSGGGVSLMVEAFGLAGITETPIVIVDSQRPGPATGLPTRTEQSDLSFLLTASQGEFSRILISVRNAEDAFYKTVKALNLADKCQTVVILLTDQYLADSNITIPKYNLNNIEIERYISNGEELKEDEEYKRYKVTQSGISPRMIPGNSKNQVVLVDSDEHTEESHITEEAEVRNAQMEKRMKKLELIKKDIEEPEFIGKEDLEILLLGFGSTYGALKDAVEELNNQGEKVGALSFGDIYPLPEESLRKYAKQAKKIINVEQNFTGQLGKLITQETGILMTYSILKYDGRQICGNDIVARLRKEEF